MNNQALPIPTKEIKEHQNIKINKWSYSRIQLFESCQRQYFYKYIMGLPTPATPPMKTGRILHRSVEWVLKEGYEPSDAVRFSIYETGMPEGENFHSLLQMVQNALYLLPGIPSNYESEVYVTLLTTLGKIRGYIDLLIENPVVDSLQIWDLKTGWQETEASKSKQLVFYAWLISELRGTALPSKLIGKLVFPRINRMTEVIFTKEDIEQARNWFIRTVSLITAKSNEIGDWDLSHDKSHCDNCPFVGRCASGISDRDFSFSGKYVAMDEAKRAGEWILLQEALLKKLKAGLKDFVENNEPVEIGSKSWFIKSSVPKPKVVDIQELMEFASDKDLEVSEILTADADKVQKWLDEDDSGMLEQLVEWTSVRKTLTYGQAPVLVEELNSEVENNPDFQPTRKGDLV